MKTNNINWQDIESLIERYQNCQLHKELNYERFYLYSIIAHSTAIEGSTLSEHELQLLFDEDITSKGKTLNEYLMNADLKDAYDFILKSNIDSEAISEALLIKLNALCMKRTGGIVNTIGGSFDSSRGEYRRCGVQVMNGKSYMNYLKVPEKMSELIYLMQEKMDKVKTLEEKYNFSFDAHLHLATIHPWVDGNGRTSRLLMNLIQLIFKLPLIKVYKEDREAYILALDKSQETEKVEYFREFMKEQLVKTIKQELATYAKMAQINKKDWKIKF